MTIKCPYCKDEKKPRGLKNHVRMASGDGHGDSGEIPADYDGPETDGDSDDADDADDDADSVDTEPETVTPDDFRPDEDESDGADDDADSDDSDLPFDPSDDDAIRLDGGETLDIRVNGEPHAGATADDGDYLLKTDKGPVLYDHKEDEMYEVLTV